MNIEFEEMFEEKFGNSFSSESTKFLHKSAQRAGWILHKEHVEGLLASTLKTEIEQNKGE